MLRLNEIVLLSLLIILPGAAYSNSDTYTSLSGDDDNSTIYWKDKFNKKEKEIVKLWLVAVNSACSEVLGKYPTIFGADDQDKTFYKRAQQQLEKVGYWQGELSHKHKNGQVYPVWPMHSNLSRSADGFGPHLQATGIDH